ncbi:hypothetical protein N136_02367 [Leifsonia aquatica ATCC 14665]|uniref:Uncharacterized protein n=1 Tax=Leifsonia aquatica ATCC 14665 TaxID=1358026 RepID=U2R7R5_LEIAQ|nr:hypothetical protein N136_02367 [Leifsonia aquatica ATCC 14665]
MHGFKAAEEILTLVLSSALQPSGRLMAAHHLFSSGEVFSQRYKTEQTI